MEKQLPVLISALWALGFFWLLLAFSKLVRPERASDASRKGFSSGEMPSGKPWIRITVRYQTLLAIAAMFFLGTLLLYPAAATFRQWIEEKHGLAALVALGLFLGTLSVALAYAWMKGDLNWIRDVENGNPGKRAS